MIRNEVIKITQSLFEEYKPGFIYVDPLQINFDKNEISGKFRFTGSAYLKKYSKILNNTEAMFIFNQLQYYLLTAQLIRNGAINLENINEAYEKLDGIVYKNMQFNFKKMITEGDELIFSCKADPYIDNKNRDCFNVSLNLVNNAFEINGTAVCLNQSVHANGLDAKLLPNNLKNNNNLAKQQDSYS